MRYLIETCGQAKGIYRYSVKLEDIEHFIKVQKVSGHAYRPARRKPRAGVPEFRWIQPAI